MHEYINRPNLPDYVSIKEAAQLLGLSDKRVYEYVDEGRLTSLWAANVIMIPLSEIMTFTRQSAGRPRKNVPVWRISSSDNTQFITTIHVQIRKYEAFPRQLKDIRQHQFSGTVARYITEHEGELTILLVWKQEIMPDERERERMLEALREDLGDTLDWSTAHYTQSKVLMHT